MRKRVIATAIVTALFGLGAAACGGDDTDEALNEAATQAETVIQDVTEQAGEAVDTATGELGEATGALPDGVSIDLEEQNASGQSGTATFSVNDDGTVHVSIEISGGGADPQPAHIHEGTCDELNPQPAFPLESVVNGASETDVDVSLDELALASYAVNVHKSEAEADVYVACGDITSVTG